MLFRSCIDRSQIIKCLKHEDKQMSNYWFGEAMKEVREPKREFICQIETQRKKVDRGAIIKSV